MPRINKKEIEKIKKEIQLYMVRTPSISAYQIAKELNRDYELICKLKREVEEEIINKIQKEKIQKAVMEFQMLIEAVMPILWNILGGKRKVYTEEGEIVEAEATPLEKIAAIKTMIEMHRILFEMKKNANMFSDLPQLPEGKNEKEDKKLKD